MLGFEPLNSNALNAPFIVVIPGSGGGREKKDKPNPFFFTPMDEPKKVVQEPPELSKVLIRPQEPPKPSRELLSLGREAAGIREEIKVLRALEKETVRIEDKILLEKQISKKLQDEEALAFILIICLTP